jgi:hypothetical protein
VLALWPYHGGLYLDTTLFDKAQVRGKRLAFIRTEVACNHRHRRLRALMISLTRLLKPALEVEIGQSPRRGISRTPLAFGP